MPGKHSKKKTLVERVLYNPLPYLIGLVLVLAIAALLIFLPRGGSDPKPTVTPVPTQQADVAGSTEQTGDVPSEDGNGDKDTDDGTEGTEGGTEAPDASSEPTQAPGPVAPAPVDISNAILPKTAQGLLPVFEKIKTEDKRIAITVDDLWKRENIISILDVCDQTGAKLTFFPIGDAVKDKKDLLLRMYQSGHEIENHTYNHVNLYSLTAEEMCKEVISQNALINEALGVDYQMHFLRPRGGNSNNDQRMHNMLSQMGYVGVSGWSISGTPEIDKWFSNAGPGDVILFHATDKDLAKLVKVIPKLVDMGYELVTLNELYNLPANETYPLGTTTIAQLDALDLPTMEENIGYDLLQKGDTSFAVRRLQLRLKELGYYEKDCDGEYGSGTVAAVTAYQEAASLKADGMAGAVTQESLFAPTAPMAPIQ